MSISSVTGAYLVDKTQSVLDPARRKHEMNASDIQTQIEALEERSQAGEGESPTGSRRDEREGTADDIPELQSEKAVTPGC